MDIVWVLLGIGIGIAVTVALLSGRVRADRDAIRDEIAASYDARATAENARIVRAYEGRIQQLREGLERMELTGPEHSQWTPPAHIRRTVDRSYLR